MKRFFYMLSILFVSLMVVSCGKSQRTLADMQKAEKKAIQRLIDEKGIEVLSKYPSNGVFKSNQFVKLDNGVYMNVIDSGNGIRATQYKTHLLVRLNAMHFVDDSATYVAAYNFYTWSNYGPHSNGTEPIEFLYGTAYTENIQFVGEGLQTPLQYVGDRARVKLIVPFKRGDYYDQQNGDPVYFDVIEYKFEEDL